MTRTSALRQDDRDTSGATEFDAALEAYASSSGSEDRIGDRLHHPESTGARQGRGGAHRLAL
jgi:hypothetical protein